jgi:hypothetical protein
MAGNKEFDAWAAANVAPTNDGPRVPESIRINSEIERMRLRLMDAQAAKDTQAVTEAANNLNDLTAAFVMAVRREEADAVVVDDPHAQRMESTRPPRTGLKDRMADVRDAPVLPGLKEQPTRAIEDVDRERQRQIAKGFNAESDDQCMQGELVFAAASFALRAIKDGSDTALFASIGLAPLRAERNFGWVGAGGLFWPWAKEFPWGNDRRMRLVKAAALLVAEIERLDRRKEV